MQENHAYRALWWLVCVSPPINVAFAFLSLTARSTDEALSGTFVTVPLLFITLITGIVAVIVTLFSFPTRAQVIATLAFAAAIIPMYFLESASWWYVGWPRGAHAPLSVIFCVGASAAWVFFAVKLRERFRRT